MAQGHGVGGLLALPCGERSRMILAEENNVLGLECVRNFLTLCPHTPDVAEHLDKAVSKSQI